MTAAFATPATACTLDGALGGPIGITAFDDADGDEVPTAFDAVTEKVYETPLLSPLTVQVSVPPVTQLLAPGLDVTVYEVIGEPPLKLDAVKTTVACAVPAVATGLVGELGAVAGVNAAVAGDGAPGPLALTAVIEIV